MFQTARNTNKIHEGALMWVFHIFLKTPAGATLNASTSLSSSGVTRQEGESLSYCAVVNCFLAAYTTCDITVVADRDIINFKQPTGQSAVEFAKALWTRALCCSLIYQKYLLEGTFIEGLRQSVQPSVQSYRPKNKSSSLLELARYALFTSNLQLGTATPDSGQ